jgi:predicted amidohydrolase YtcJ
MRARARLGLAIVAVGCGAAMPAVAQARVRSADTVLRHGFIYTADRQSDVARAMAVRNGVIVYVGSDKRARAFVGRHTKVIDLHGRMVMPGLQDGHIHGVTNDPQKTCDLQAKPLTVDEFRARIRACLADPELHTSTPAARDDFLVASNFYIQFLRPPGTDATKALFDGLTDRPIIVHTAITGHEVVVNQAALDLAGIDRNTPDPEGGRIVHGPDGNPNGLLTDRAVDLVEGLVPPPPALTKQKEVDLAASRMKDFAREGVTSFFQPLASPDLIRTFYRLRQQHRLTARAHFAPLAGQNNGDLAHPKSLYARMQRLRKSVERPRQAGPRLVAEPGVSVDAVKFFMDGVLQYPDQTAALFKPYLDEHGNPRQGPRARGDLFIQGKVLDPVVIAFMRRGFQPHIHAIGDRAVHVALNAFGAARKANRSLERRSRPTIAHAELVDRRDYARFGTLGVTASMGLQWAKPAPDSTEAVKPYLGSRFGLYEPEYPITKAGGRVSMGSDCCLDPFDEWFDLEAAILRKADWGPDFPEFAGRVNALPGLSLKDAIRVVTINGAYQMHQDRVTGSLERGKLADLVVLNQNIAKVRRDDISKTDPVMTMVGGKRVWVDPSVRRSWGREQTF